MTHNTERLDLASKFINDTHARYNERPHAREADSVGITNLINCLRKTWLRRHDCIPEDPDDQDFKLTTLIGTAYHALLPPMNAPKEQHVRLTAKDDDGNRVGDVTCYIDWLEPETGGGQDDNWDVPEGDTLIPCELKTTRASANKPPHPHYVEQLAGEVLMGGKDKGRLYILYLVGNYRPPTPQLKVFEYNFSREEMNAWGMELTRRLLLVIGDELPPIEDHFKWECKYCPIHNVMITLPNGEEFMCPGGPGRGDAGFFDNEAEALDGLIQGWDVQTEGE